MKVKILHFTTAFFLVAGALLSISAKAQHEGLSPGELQDPNHLEYSLNDDKPLLTEHDSKSKGPTRDSIALHNRPVSTGTPSTSQNPLNTVNPRRKTMPYPSIFYTTSFRNLRSPILLTNNHQNLRNYSIILINRLDTYPGSASSLLSLCIL